MLHLNNTMDAILSVGSFIFNQNFQKDKSTNL